MAVPNMMDPLEWLRQHLGELDPDLVRLMLATFAEELMYGHLRKKPTQPAPKPRPK